MVGIGLATAIGIAAAWYVAAVRRSALRPPAWRAAAFLGGLAAVGAALSPPVDARVEGSFTAHMVQHLLLTSLAAPLLLLGRPLTVALRSGRWRRALSAIVRSRTFGAVTHPVVAWVAFVAAMYASHLGPLYEAALRSEAWHALEHALFLGTALLFWLPVVGDGPAPHRLGHGGRLLYLALAMPAEAFLALAIFSADRVLYPSYAGPEALGDQRAAAALLWVVGDLVVLAALVLVALAWKADEEARQRRLEEGHGVGATPAPR